MNSMICASQKLQQSLGLKFSPIGISFSNVLPKISRKSDGIFYTDTACTALCRSLKNGKTLVIAPEGNTQGVPSQPCAGANFFLKMSLTPVATEEAVEVYTKTEQVFCSKKICQVFLESIPDIPESLCGKFIVLSPLGQAEIIPQVVVCLVNAAQAGKMLGLSVFRQYVSPVILPAAPTCLSLYLPLCREGIHLNFVDYYDRYHQGERNGKLIWSENDIVVSMSFSVFLAVAEDLDFSPHGNFKPHLEPRPFDIINSSR